VERNQTHEGSSYHYLDVASARFEDILDDVSVPYYLKIDIEGLDMLCVQALHRFDRRPDFVSVESNAATLRAPFEPVFDELAQLWTLGYRSFKYVDQQRESDGEAAEPPSRRAVCR